MVRTPSGQGFAVGRKRQGEDRRPVSSESSLLSQSSSGQRDVPQSDFSLAASLVPTRPTSNGQGLTVRGEFQAAHLFLLPFEDGHRLPGANVPEPYHMVG